MKKVCLSIGIALLFTLVFSPKALARGQILERKFRVGHKYVPGEIIVKFKRGVRENEIATSNSRHGTSVFYTSRFAGFKRLRIPGGKTVAEMVEAYNKDPSVEYAEANYIAYALWSPNDEFYSYQWHLDNPEYGGIRMEEAWQSLGAPGTPGEDVIVAIVDTGIAYEDYQESRRKKYEQASDLAETCFVAGYDFVNNDTHANDDSSPGHGTHVAGTVAQSTDNSIGASGIAFNACLMPVKVLDSGGSGTYADVADGIYFAAGCNPTDPDAPVAEIPADIINLSLGGGSPSDTLRDAVKYAYEVGVTVIAAAGNNGESGGAIDYPAAYDDYVIAVGATRYDETLAYYSSYGSSLDLVAPGGDLYVDQNGDGFGDGVLQQSYEKVGWRTISWNYYFMSGTSMAAPHVSAVAALLIANGNVIGPDEIRSALRETAEDLGDPGRDDIYGWGLIDACAALQWSAEPEVPVLTTIVVSPSSKTLNEGETQQFTAAGKDQYGNPISTGTITWGINDGAVGTIDSGGLFTALAAGTTTVSATSGVVVGTATVTVEEVPVLTTIVVSPSSKTLNEGETQLFSAAGKDQFGDPIGTGPIIWDSNDEAVGTIDSGGLFTAVVAGTATVSATSGEVVGTATVTVEEVPVLTTIVVSPSSKTLNEGETQQFTAAGKDQYGNPISTGTITWGINDGAVGTIDSGGLFTAVVAGTATVSATSGEVVGTATVTVEETPSVITVFFDSFESSSDWTANWSQDTQNDWRRRTARKKEGSYAAEVDGRANDAQLISIPINLQGKTDATITFWWYIERGLDTGEYLAFDVSVDGGANWVEKARLSGNVDAENTWHNVSIGLSGINSLRIRFRGKMSRSNEDAYVDVVEVIAE